MKELFFVILENLEILEDIHIYLCMFLFYRPDESTSTPQKGTRSR